MEAFGRTAGGLAARDHLGAQRARWFARLAWLAALLLGTAALSRAQAPDEARLLAQIDARIARAYERSSDPAELQACVDELGPALKAWLERPPVGAAGRQGFLKAACFVYACQPEPVWIEVCSAALLGTKPGDGLEPERSYLLYSLCHALVSAGQLETADRLFAHEMPQLEPARPAYLGWACFVRGLLRKVQGRPVQALEDYQRAAACEDPTGGQLEGILRVELAGVHLELGLPDLALKQLGSATDLTSELQRARIELYSGRRVAALRRVEQALKQEFTAEQAGERDQLRLQQAIALSEQGQVEPARELFAALVESASLSQVERMEARLQRALLELRAGNLPAARAELYHSGDDPLTPLQKVRWATTRAMWERMRGATREELIRARDSLELAQEEFFRLWEETPILDSGIGFLQYDIRRSTLGERITLDTAIDGALAGAERGVALLLRAQTLGTLSRQWKLAVPTLQEVRERLIPEHGGLLMLLPAPFGSHLFVIDDRELRHHALAPSARLETALQRHARAIIARPNEKALSEWRSASEALAAELLPAEVQAQLLRWKSVGLIGFDSFGFAPLEALEIPNLGVLGDRWAVHTLPSAPVGIELAKRAGRPQTAPRRMLLAPRIPEQISARWSGLVPIPWGAAQTQELRAALGSTPWELVLDKEATRERFFAPCTELVVLTHGVEALERDQPAGLVLADSPQPVFYEDIVAWKSAPELVLLAACGTRRGAVRRGDEGLNHIGGAFHVAGVPTVIASAADLDYDSTRELLLEFCRARSKGAAISEALRRARVKLAGDPRYAHPYYRSLLVISGPADR